MSSAFGSGRRLHRPEEFSAVLAGRRVVRGEWFDLHFLDATGGIPGIVRFGLIVPKRLARKATVRNAIKRQGREAVRLKFPCGPGYDLVLRLKRQVKDLGCRDGAQRRLWRTDIQTLLEKLPGLQP